MLNDAYLYKKTFNENFSINRAIKNVTHKFWNDDFPKPMNEPEFKKYNLIFLFIKQSVPRGF